jgi:hypothetical protein
MADLSARKMAHLFARKMADLSARKMADFSRYWADERLVSSVWVHESPHTGQTAQQVMTLFQQRFRKQRPRKSTFLPWEKGVFASGSVKESRGSGRPLSRLIHLPLLPTASVFHLADRHSSGRRNSEYRLRPSVITWRTYCWSRLELFRQRTQLCGCE